MIFVNGWWPHLLRARATGRLRRGLVLRFIRWCNDRKRTINDTWRHIGTLIATIEPDECENHFANAGYASVKS